MGIRREALNLRPKEETGESRGGGRPEEKRQRRTSFRHAPVANLTQNHRKTNPKSTKSTAPPASIRTITTSPSLQRRWGHTQTSFLSPDLATIRREPEQEKQGGREEPLAQQGEELDRGRN
ncbi:hypothetical protein DY000_02057969 [Brassica cretica]|uniref:Uncharacterized protein n=1 Tax=Brassica cretica TaxID=69181 RepID=A0ABQ7AIQ3_BRACR|nr:hypothetical protein DY000_02057969 [Brassica cretica]